MSEDRKHHPYSPSSLQPTEACPCYQGKDSTHIRTIIGTISHKVTETREDDNRLDDDDAANAAECLDFYDGRVAEAKKFREADCEKTKEILPAIIEHQEIYLPVDDLEFPDGIKHTTAGYVDRALVAHNREYAELFDWKFGRWPVEKAENNLQGIAYSLGLFKKYPTLKTVVFFFKQPLTEQITHAVFRREDIPALYLRIQVVVARAREARALIEKDDWSMAKPYVPVCNFCANIGKCKKVTEIAISVAQKYYPLEIPANIDPMKLMDKHNTNLAMRLSGVMAVWAKAYRDRVTDRVIRRDMDTPEGFTLTSRADRKVKDPKKLKELSLNYMTEEEWNALLPQEPPFGKMEDKVQEHAVRGQKKATLEKFQQEALDIGAVEKGDPYTFLRAVADKEDKNTKTK